MVDIVRPRRGERPRVLVTPASLCERPQLLEAVSHLVELDFRPEGVPTSMAGYQCIVLGNETFGQAELARSDSLVLIARYGVTVHNVDVDTAMQHGITVTNCPTLSAVAVAEYVLAAIFYFAKTLHRIDGISARAARPVVLGDVAGRTLGIIGLGDIGRTLARRARALGMSVIVYNRTPRREFCAAHGIQQAALNQTIAAADYLSVNLRLTPQTAGLLSGESLDLLRPHAVVINTAQAAVVDSASLIAKVRSGEIGGFVSDFGGEHWNPGHDRSVVTPHISGRTQSVITAKVELLIRILTALATGADYPREAMFRSPSASSVDTRM